MEERKSKYQPYIRLSDCVVSYLYWNLTCLDRKSSASSLEHFRRQGAGGSLTRRGSLERRAHAQNPILSSGSEEIAHHLDTFKPIKITMHSFFKQVYL